MEKCEWCLGKFPEYERYHDQEWGVPVYDDDKHFEFLILEAAQAGLSWATVLKRRKGYRKAFRNFDPEKVAKLTQGEVEKLYTNPAIIRNKLKIDAAVHNSKPFLAIQEEHGSFSEYIWGFVKGETIQNSWKSLEEVPVTTKESDLLSRDLKSRGFKFVGSTVIYAHMQACGLVNDHTVDCFRYSELK